MNDEVETIDQYHNTIDSLVYYIPTKKALDGIAVQSRGYKSSGDEYDGFIHGSGSGISEG